MRIIIKFNLRFVLKDTDFNINKEDFVFFENLLKTEPNDNNIVFKKTLGNLR